MRVRYVLSLSVALVSALSLAWTGATPALAQVGSPCAPGGPTAQYPPAQCGLSISASQVTPGQPITVSGAGFRANSTVRIEFRSAPVTLTSVQANSAGVFSATVTIPADATPGTHTLAAIGVDAAGGARELTSTVTVLGAETARAGTLPVTGSSSTLPAGLAGIVLVGVGSAAVVAARRRRTA